MAAGAAVAAGSLGWMRAEVRKAWRGREPAGKPPPGERGLDWCGTRSAAGRLLGVSGSPLSPVAVASLPPGFSALSYWGVGEGSLVFLSLFSPESDLST